MHDMNRKIFDWSKVKSWADKTFSPITHNHNDKYSPLGHTHTDTIYGSMPDFSRAMHSVLKKVGKSQMKSAIKNMEPMALCLVDVLMYLNASPHVICS
jgi:hypothetical protein